MCNILATHLSDMVVVMYFMHHCTVLKMMTICGLVTCTSCGVFSLASQPWCVRLVIFLASFINAWV